MSKVSCYAFYGSLRKGMYNFGIYKDYLQFLSTETLFGFKLYALTDYPIAIKTRSNDDSIIAEIFKITDPAIESEIHKMEIDAGYYFDIADVYGTKAGIYLFKDPSKLPVVTGGDWVKYFEKRINSE